MHQKIIYTPQFYCLKNLCSLHLSPLSALRGFLPRRSSLSFCLGVSTVQVAEQSGHTSDTKRYATGSQERVCKGSTGRDGTEHAHQDTGQESWSESARQHSLPARTRRLLRTPDCSGRGTGTSLCSQSTSSGPPFLSR